MDSLTFIAAMADHLAWPLAAVIALLTFRSPISARIRTLRRFKYGELEFDLAEEVWEVRQAAETSPALAAPAPKALPPGPSPELPPPWMAQARAMAETSPLSAVLLAWAALALKVDAVLHRLGIPFEG